MTKQPVNPNCPLSGTRYCRLLNMGSCERCTVATGEDGKDIMRDIDLYESLLPEGGVAGLFRSHACQFCRQEPKGERAGYAILDMAHPEPKRVQKWLLGTRKSKFGTMIPVQMSICKRCRATFRWIDTIPSIVPIVVGAAGLFVFGTGAVAEALADIQPMLPFLCWIVLLGAGVLIGRLAAKAMMRRANGRMLVDVLAHPVVAEMSAKGWVPIMKQSSTKLLFTTKRINRGLGTAVDVAVEAGDAPETPTVEDID